jgi:hypothetical protein
MFKKIIIKENIALDCGGFFSKLDFTTPCEEYYEYYIGVHSFTMILKK